MNHSTMAASPPDPDVEGRAVRSAQQGDVEAFEELYRRHVGRVYALCMRMTADRSAAEELTQRVWIRAWERLGSFRGESSFSTWLHRVAVNVALGERRADARRGARLELAGEVAQVERASRADASDAIALDRAVAELPERARRVFVLHDVYGHAQSEVAALLGIAEGTVKSQLHRARRLLREALA